MKEYLISVYQPDGDPPPPEELDKIMADVDRVEDEMRAAGVWVFTARLLPASSATVVRAAEGEVMLTDGPFTEGKEHLGGFTIIRATDLDAALAWAGRLARILPLPLEVRPVA